MRRFGRVLAGVFGIALAVFGVVFSIAVIGALRRSQPDFGDNVGAAVFFVAVTIAGLFLIRVAWPGWLGGLPKGIFSRNAVHSPVVHAPGFYVAGSLLALVSGRAALLAVLAVLCLYAVVSPALIAMQPRWWLNAIWSTVFGLVLAAALPATAEALSRQHFGEGAMVLLFPITVFPLTLLGSLVFRLIAARSTRRAVS